MATGIAPGLADKLRAASNNQIAQRPTTTNQSMITPQTITAPQVKAPQYNEQSTTNYGGKGSALNEILNSKKQYDAGVASGNSGLKNWASNNAQQFYGQLDPEQAALVKGFDTQGLIDYINNMNTPVGSGGVTGTSEGTEGLGGIPSNTGGQQPPSGYQSSYTGPDLTGMTKQLQDIFSNRQASELQKLREARDIALQGYASQETLAKDNAYDNRNQSDTVNLQNEQRMKETMANAGLTTDGQNLTVQAGQNAQRLGDLGAINRQESNALQDIGQKRTLLQNNAANDELALTQQINSDQASALYDLMKYGDTRAFDVDNQGYSRYRDDVNQQFAQDQFGWQQQTDLASLLGTINGQQTLAGQNQAFNQEMSLADLLGTYNGQQTLGGKASDLADKNSNWAAYMDIVNQTQNLGKGPAQNWSNLVNNANGGTKTAAGQQQETSNQQWQASFDRGKYESDRAYQQQKQQEAISNGQWQQTFNQDVEKFGFQKASELWSQSFQENQANTKSQEQKSASPNEVGTLLENLQLQGQDSNGDSYGYIPGKGKPARAAWVQQAVQTLVDANYDNATISQVLRKAGITPEEENDIFGSGE